MRTLLADRHAYVAGRYRIPITIAWSTPGGALLAASPAPVGGWPTAVGAFVVTGLHLTSTPHFSIGFTLVVPHFDWQAVVGIAVPLWLVTMASQNVPGVAVLKSFGYETPWRPTLLTTGIGTVVGAFAGGHAICMAAISAALAAAIVLAAPGALLPAAVTFLVAASGITVLGIGGAFWALVVGVLLRLVLVRRTTA